MPGEPRHLHLPHGAAVALCLPLLGPRRWRHRVQQKPARAGAGSIPTLPRKGSWGQDRPANLWCLTQSCLQTHRLGWEQMRRAKLPSRGDAWECSTKIEEVGQPQGCGASRSVEITWSLSPGTLETPTALSSPPAQLLLAQSTSTSPQHHQDFPAPGCVQRIPSRGRGGGAVTNPTACSSHPFQLQRVCEKSREP